MNKIAVICGGRSTEKEISQKTGQAVLAALNECDYSTRLIDPSQEGWTDELKTFSPQLVFIGLHGKEGEDGTIQGYLETLGYPYTGSGLLASAMTMDKVISQRNLREAGLRVPDFISLDKEDWKARKDHKEIKEIEEKILSQIGLPLVVKAPSQGSSIGIYFVDTAAQLGPAIQAAFSYEDRILIEKKIVGMEITVSVLGNKDPLVLPTLEITTSTGAYDYQTKYTPGLSQHIIPARLKKETRQRCRSMALKAYKTLGLSGFGRVDFMLDEKETPYILELNTIPGMTQTSLIPDAACHVGLSFKDLVEGICLLALDKPWPALDRLKEEISYD